MEHGHHQHGQPAVTAADRSAEAQRATWVSVAVNLLMTIVQLVIGWLAHSQSLVAHGLHSFSDLLSDFLVIYATRQSAHPADDDHPYGHARFETAATLILGISLVAIGGGILWDSGMRLQELHALPEIAISALVVAILTVIAKEALYRYLIRVAEKLRSQLLTANALHTRADAASALVVVVGVGGALMGWGFLDTLAAAIMGFMILRMGAGLAWDAIKELIDTGLDGEQVDAIRATISATPGVIDLHELRTRRMAHQALVDAHVQVNSRISVSEGHCIAELVRHRVLKAHPEVLDLLVHIDPEDDTLSGFKPNRQPGRAEMLSQLAPLLEGLPEPQKVVLHYLKGKVEAEVFLDHGFFESSEALRQAEMRIGARLQDHPAIRSISLNCLIAP